MALSNQKKLAYLLTISFGIGVIVAIFSCFIALFVEISDLKSRMSSIEDKAEELANVEDGRLQQLNASIENISDQLANELSSQQSFLGQFAERPTSSCAALPPSSPSGYYWVRASNGSAVRVYCDMTRTCGGVTGGWRRVAELNMTNSSHQCPSGLSQQTDSNIRTCVRDSNFAAGCSSVTFSAATLGYSRVCGKIIAYQFGSPDTFADSGRGSNLTIDSNYVDGVSLTHGNPREHIWTFAAGNDEDASDPHYNCPCTNTNTASSATQPPAFVGNDYFCDTGIHSHFQPIFYGDNPLWDGAGCGPLNTCCSFNNPPWFYKQLPQPTTDDIEMRVCRDQDASDENVAIETVEIYVK